MRPGLSPIRGDLTKPRPTAWVNRTPIKSRALKGRPIPQTNLHHGGTETQRGRAATKVWHGHPGRDRFTGWKPVPRKSSQAAK